VKHFILLIVLALLAYFGWQYTPNRTKFFIKDFLVRHALKVIAIWVGLWAGLFFAVHNGSINIL
jgi:hypothetical protein